MYISKYVWVIKACRQDVVRMYEKSRLKFKSVDVKDERKGMGMSSQYSPEDATRKGRLGRSISLAVCGDAIHSFR